MKKDYQSAEVDIIIFEAEDVITNSPCPQDTNYEESGDEINPNQP